jgi:hypothetical protein
VNENGLKLSGLNRTVVDWNVSVSAGVHSCHVFFAPFVFTVPPSCYELLLSSLSLHLLCVSFLHCITEVITHTYTILFRVRLTVVGEPLGSRAESPPPEERE